MSCEYPGVHLYPGELLNGALGRLERRWGLSLRRFTGRLLNGRSERMRSAYDFRSAPLWHNLWGEPGLEHLLLEHTLLPLYTWRITFSGQQPRKVNAGTGLEFRAYMPNPTHSTFYKYCPACWEEQMQKHGESRWDVLCQVPGVDICLKHGIALVETELRLDARNIAREDGYPTPELAREHRRMHPDDHSLLLARTAKGLLERKQTGAVKITDWLDYLCWLMTGDRLDMRAQYRLLQSRQMGLRIRKFWGYQYRKEEGWLFPLKNLKGIGWWGWLKLLKAINPEKDLADAINECREMTIGK